MPSSLELKAKAISKIKILREYEEIDNNHEECSADEIKKKMWGVLVLHDKSEIIGNFTMKPEAGDLVSCQDYKTDDMSKWKNILSIHMPKTKTAVRKRLRDIFNSHRSDSGYFLKTKELEYLAELRQGGAWEILCRDEDDIKQALQCTTTHAKKISLQYQNYWTVKSDCKWSEVERFTQFLRSKSLDLTYWNVEIVEEMCNKFGSIDKCEVALQYPLMHLQILMSCGVKKINLQNLMESDIELPETTRVPLLVYFDFLDIVRGNGHSFIHHDEFLRSCVYTDDEIMQALTVLITQECIYEENNILYDVELYNAEKRAARRIARIVQQRRGGYCCSASDDDDDACPNGPLLAQHSCADDPPVGGSLAERSSADGGDLSPPLAGQSPADNGPNGPLLAQHSCADATTDEASYSSLNPEQIQGIRNALSESMSIITGGPGTGKTTTIKMLIDSFFRISGGVGEILVCAPTGKAVYRLIQSIGKEYLEKGVHFKTMHKFIYETKVKDIDDDSDRDDYVQRHRSRRDAQKDRKYDLVICDEASMVGTLVFDQFIDAIIKTGTVDHVVFCGDKNQLEPVDPGCVFEQLLVCTDIPRVDLTRTYRQKHNASDLSKGIQDIHKGCLPAIQENDGSLVIHHVPAHRKNDNPEIKHMVMETLKEYRKKYPFENILVLTPSVKAFKPLKEEIRELVNPFTGGGDSENQKNKRGFFRVGDFVSQRVNMYADPKVDGHDTVLFRGMTGTILQVEVNEDCAVPRRVRFTDGSESDWEKGLQLQFSYINTVHKAQGSECAAVIFAFDNLYLFNKKIVYTAVSRAKNECTIIGPLSKLKECIEKQVETRRSRLSDYIIEELTLSSLASCAIAR
jgi:ATP:corrinoid adenosyltransferase